MSGYIGSSLHGRDRRGEDIVIVDRIVVCHEIQPQTVDPYIMDHISVKE